MSVTAKAAHQTLTDIFQREAELNTGNRLLMASEYKPIFTNVRIFSSIAHTAYKKMSEDMRKSIRPKPDGSPGVIKEFDPTQVSFKEAMISIVFSCIWLEATLHLLIVQNRGRECFKKVDRSPYEEKLRLLECGDERLLRNVNRLQIARKELVHEKAHFDFSESGEFTGKLMTAQDEAENARAVVVGVKKWCQEAFNVDVP